MKGEGERRREEKNKHDYEITVLEEDDGMGLLLQNVTRRIGDRGKFTKRKEELERRPFEDFAKKIERALCQRAFKVCFESELLWSLRV